MAQRIILASGSATRARLLRQAGVPFEIMSPRVDEVALRAAFAAEGLSPRDQSDALAEQKARKIAARQPGAFVIGSDQILAHGQAVLGKPETPEAAHDQLVSLSGSAHTLYTAVVVCDGGVAVWRHLSESRLHMRPLSRDYIDSYLLRHWDSVKSCVGAYKIEEEGIRLFEKIEGDFFSILGLPLLPLLSYLGQRGLIQT